MPAGWSPPPNRNEAASAVGEDREAAVALLPCRRLGQPEHPGPGRSLMQHHQHRLQRRPLTFEVEGHAAIAAVAYPAVHAQLLGAQLHEAPETNALHSA